MAVHNEKDIENKLNIVSSYVHYLSHIKDINSVEEVSKKRLREFERFKQKKITNISGIDVKAKLEHLEYLLTEKSRELKEKEGTKSNLILDKKSKEKYRKELEILYNQVNIKYDDKLRYTKGARKAYLQILHYLNSVHLLTDGKRRGDMWPTELEDSFKKLFATYTAVKKDNTQISSIQLLRLLEEATFSSKDRVSEEYTEMLDVLKNDGKADSHGLDLSAYKPNSIIEKAEKLSAIHKFMEDIKKKNNRQK